MVFGDGFHDHAVTQDVAGDAGDDALTALSGVDGISGATITTIAVKRAVYAALNAVEEL